MQRVIASKSFLYRSALVRCLPQLYMLDPRFYSLLLCKKHFPVIYHYDICFSMAVTIASFFKFYPQFPFYAAIRLFHARKFSCHFYCLFFSFSNLVSALLLIYALLSFVSFCRFQISTLATKLGVRNIAFLGSGLLLINYIGAVLAAIYVPQVNASN